MNEAKEKAKELVEKYVNLLPLGNNLYKIAKLCAKIVVEEIIDAIDWHEFEVPNKEIEHWEQVKKEICDL